MNISSISFAGTSATSMAQMSMMRGSPPNGADFAAKLLEEGDADGDGALSIGETRLSEEMFAEIDTDGDGLLTTEEIEADISSHEAERPRGMPQMPQSDSGDDPFLALLEALGENEASSAYSEQSWFSSMLQSSLEGLNVVA